MSSLPPSPSPSPPSPPPLPSPFVIGYALNPKKSLTFHTRGLFLNPTSSTLFIPIDLTSPLAPQHSTPFHTLLIKATDTMTASHPTPPTSPPASPPPLHHLTHYLRTHPDCVIIDDLTAVERVLDRCVVSQLIGGVGDVGGGWRVEAPASRVVQTGVGQEGTPQPTLSFPVICKPLPACGSPSSHLFYLLYTPFHLSLVPPSTYLMQRLIPHRTLYKVYVLGASSHVISRSSLPPSLTRPSPIRPPLTLDSQTMQVRTMQGGVRWEEGEEEVEEGNGGERGVKLREMGEGARRAVERVSQRLGEVFGLTLFGYDVIVPEEEEEELVGEGSGESKGEGGRLMVVDVNYFPSYNQVEGLSEKLLDVIRAKYRHEMSRRTAPTSAPSPHSNGA